MKIEIPQYFFETKYNGQHYPGAQGVNGLKGGANCQVFVYQLLIHFGYNPLPDFRSSELWEDTAFTEKVNDIKAMDILFWNNTNESWGAHVGLA
ncbi:MAG: cell wall hydrolase, partial [Bacteroidota bacterium]